MTLSFLEANKIIQQPNALDTHQFVLATSGQIEKIDIFLKANSILNGFNSNYTTLPFNTLLQYLAEARNVSEKHVFLLYPWDVLPEMDWRTGQSSESLNLNESVARINEFINQITQYNNSRIIFVDADSLPVTFDYQLNKNVQAYIKSQLLSINAVIMSSSYFSLSSYLSNGCPISSKRLSDLSESIIGVIDSSRATQKKIIITDFDNVMWKGIIGEDGIDGIECSSEGAGFIHAIYQSILLHLKSQGILIAGVTRNDNKLAREPFKANKTLFKESDFVVIAASYFAKSAQIKKIMSDLNLGIDSALFIDDNPIEIAEVSEMLPEVECIQFPLRDENFSGFIDKFLKFFDLKNITDDDRKRTELYKIRYESSGNSHEPGADLSEYIKSLKMELSVEKCTTDTFQRPLQLLNKTNQFNLNGRRLTDKELVKYLENGYTLFSFSLSDKFGNHGQIACLLISENNIVEFFVMSCRVFQRRVELAIIYWLCEMKDIPNINFKYIKTIKNIPFQMFIDDHFHRQDEDGILSLNTNDFMNDNASVLDFLKLSVDIND